MKRRRVLILLALTATALLLVLPGMALAAYETPTQVVIQAQDQGTHYWDLDTGTVFPVDTTDPSSDIHVEDGAGGAYTNPGYFTVNMFWTAPVTYYSFVDPDTGTPTRTFASITYADLTGLPWQSENAGNLPSPFVICTAEGNYFKLQCESMGGVWPTYSDWVWQVQRLVPSDPPAMLNDLKGFIAAPTTGTVDPLIAPSLTAKVNAALAALARNNENDAKVAMNDLKALVNQVEAQTDKKISADAAASIISKANAITTALGY